MTEAEAKNKLCPFTFGQSTEPPHNGPRPCCASGCMAWQFDVRFSHVDGDPSKNVYAETGHCGLVRQS